MENDLLEIIYARDKRTKAAGVLWRALRDGKIKRGPCQVCGRSKGKWGDLIQAHHLDYDKPLEVIWLCARHHKSLHINLRRKGLRIQDSLQIVYHLVDTPKTQRQYAIKAERFTSRNPT